MEWTHTSANLQHAKTTARREQSRESDAPEKHWGLGENGGDAVARQTLPPPRRSLHLTSEEYTSRGACTSTLPPGTSGSRQGLGSRRPHSLAPSSEATSLSLPPTARALQRVSATHWRQEGGAGALACAPFIHPLLWGDVDPVGGAAPVDRQEPRRPTCSGRLRSGAQHKVALDSAGLGRGSPAVDRLDLRWAVGRAQVVVALSRGGRLSTARHTADTPPNTAQGGGVQRARAGAAGAEQGAAAAC